MKADYLIIIQTPPSLNIEPIEMALAMAAFEQDVALVFVGSGIYHLLNSQTEKMTGAKSPSKLIAALPMYDCEKIYYCDSDIEGNIKINSPIVEMISNTQLQSLVASAKHTVSF